MARLSGLASEHHPEGPGDAPRRKRGRKSHAHTPSVELTSSNGKRAASPAESAVAHIKRVKRVQLDDSQQLQHELDDAVSRSSQADDTTTAAAETPDNRRSRRHSEPFVPVREEDEEEDELANSLPATQPLPGLTPHLDRVGASRGRPTNAFRRARMSMPAQLQVHSIDDTNGENEHQFAPLSAVLDGRMKRRLRRSHLSEEVNEFESHKKEDTKMRKALADLRRELKEKNELLENLNYQLEANRMGRIEISDAQVEELEGKLAQANKELDDLKASSIYATSESIVNGNMVDDDDDDDQILIDPEDLNISQEQLEVEPHPNGVYATRALEMSSQVTFQTLETITETTQDTLFEASQGNPAAVPDKISDQAVRRFESEFERLTEQLASSQGALRIVAVELQNLHVVAPGASSNDILDALRHGFDHVRDELEMIVPGATIGLTNAQLLRKLIQTIKDIMAELTEKVVIAEKHNKSETLLRAEVDGLLDLLTTSEGKVADLEKSVANLDNANEEKERRIVELDERVVTLEKAADDQEEIIGERDLKIHGLEDEIEEKDTDLGRLRTALDKYRTDVDDLTETVTRLEQEHAATIADMEMDHKAVLSELQNSLDTETEARELAEAEAQQKTDYIEELEARIERLDADIEEFTTQMARLKQLYDEETELRKATEQQLDEQEGISADFGNQIEELKEQIKDLEAEVAEFRENLDAERTQRVQTEASLDEANEKIDELTDRLHNEGLQANQLRTKLFQVQQDKEAAIAKLTAEANEREKELEEMLGNETDVRTNAQAEVATLDAQCNQLQTNLTATELALEQMTQARDDLEADRNEKVAQGIRTRDDLAKRLAALENTSASTITSLQANITDLTNDVAALQATIQQLKADAAEAHQQYTDTLADRDATIVDLEENLIQERNMNQDLMAENKSLAKRVEDEAHELLNIMGAHAQEANGLRQAIAAKDATILTLQTNANQQTTEFAEQLSEKVQEIEELRIMGDNRAEVIVALQAQIEELKEKFREAEADTRATMDALTESRRKLQDENDQLAAALIKRNADALKAVQEMKIKGVEVKTTGAGDLHKISSGKITKVSERIKIGKKKTGGVRKSKRQWDSGFGVDENIENEETLDEALVAE